MGPQVRVGLMPALQQISSDLLGRLGEALLGTLPPGVSCCTWVNLPGSSVHRALPWSTESAGHLVGAWNMEIGFP